MIYPTQPTAPKAARGSQAAATGRGCTRNVGTTLLSPGITWVCSATPLPKPSSRDSRFHRSPSRRPGCPHAGLSGPHPGCAGSAAGVANLLLRELSGRCHHSCLHVHSTGQSPAALLSSMKATSSGRVTKTDKVKETQLLLTPRCPFPGGAAARGHGSREWYRVLLQNVFLEPGTLASL